MHQRDLALPPQTRSVRTLESSLRKETRRADRLQRDTNLKEGDYLANEKGLKAVERRFAVAQDEYRSKLLMMLAPEPDSQRSGSKPLVAPDAPSTPDATRRMMVDELARTYKTNEKTLHEERSALLNERRNLVSQNRALYRKVCDLADYLDEHNAPTSVLPTTQDMELLKPTPEELERDAEVHN